MTLRDLLRGDGLQVPEYLDGGRAVRLRVVDHRLDLRGHPGEIPLALHDLEGNGVGRLLVHRDRLVGRAPPARLGHAGRAQPEPLLEQPVFHVQQLRQPVQFRQPAVGLLRDQRPVHRYDQRGLVVDQWLADVVEYPAPDRRHDDRPGLVLRRRAGVGPPRHDLQVP